jgi:hypothetical protein
VVGDHTGILGAEVLYRKCNLSICRLSGLGHGGTAHATWSRSDSLYMNTDRQAWSFVGVGRLSVGDRVGRPERKRDGLERQTTRTEETDETDESDTYRL